MPFYDYKCKNCKIKIEVFHSSKNSKNLYCEICKEDSLEKIISRTSFILKGSGWYETDFKNKKKPEPKSSSSNNTKKDKTASKKSSNKEK